LHPLFSFIGIMEEWNIGIMGEAEKKDAEKRRFGDAWFDRLTMIGLARSS
jgi:hypothetical protein